jgi:hypothetical protein
VFHKWKTKARKQFTLKNGSHPELQFGKGKECFQEKNIELCANERKIRLKKERDDSRAETLRYLENHPHDQLITMHDITKAALLSNSNTNA